MPAKETRTLPRLGNRIPKYRLHKQSGQAIVTINGRDHLLGPHGTKASKIEYDRLIAEWLQHGRQIQPGPQNAELTVVELIVAYMHYVRGYYRQDGHPVKRLNCTFIHLAEVSWKASQFIL